jgi:hypothetical protein
MTRPIKIILFSRHAETREELARELDALRTDFPDFEFVTFEMNAMSSVDKTAQLVMLDLETWIPSDEMVLSDLRAAGFEGSVIVLTKRVGESSSQSYGTEKVIFYDRSRGIRELLGITKRTLLGSLVAARKHPRHPTNETAEMQIDGIRGIYICNIKNLSKGGAFLELTRALNIRIGDTVILKINLEKVNRVYSVRARIAWIQSPGLGVEFLTNI